MHVHYENMCNHFANIAPLYRNIRITGLELNQCISEKLKGLANIGAIDIGCGSGRYDLLLFYYLNNLHPTCVDINTSMLRQASDYLKINRIQNYTTLKPNFIEYPLKKVHLTASLFLTQFIFLKCLQFIKEANNSIKKTALSLFTHAFLSRIKET